MVRQVEIGRYKPRGWRTIEFRRPLLAFAGCSFGQKFVLYIYISFESRSVIHFRLGRYRSKQSILRCHFLFFYRAILYDNFISRWLHVRFSADQITLKTVVAEPSQKPIWNATLLFSGVDGESLMKRAIEVTLWDFCPDGDNVFLGECTVDLERALENDRAVW